VDDDWRERDGLREHTVWVADHAEMAADRFRGAQREAARRAT
jgi:hypothetical protein